MENTRKTQIMEAIATRFENEDFCNGIVLCKDESDTQKFLVENGINITFEETAELLREGRRLSIDMFNSELDENALENVAGGWSKCKICGKTVNGNWWKKYKHCLGHASRCLPWGEILSVALCFI